MPLITHEEAIKGYWKEVGDKYPDIPFDKFEMICKSPFKAIREWIKRGDLPWIMIKFLGKFMVTEGKIKDMMGKNQYLFDRKIRPEHIYLEKKKFYEAYLKDLEREKQKDEYDLED